jgi:hypothetical protein
MVSAPKLALACVVFLILIAVLVIINTCITPLNDLLYNVCMASDINDLHKSAATVTSGMLAAGTIILGGGGVIWLVVSAFSEEDNAFLDEYGRL